MAGLAAPAITQSQSSIRWRFQSSFNQTLNKLWNEHENFARRVSQMTDGRFRIEVFAGGEIVGGLHVLDGVQNGTVAMGQS
jgi:TRAP-type mannitol/chloroaromatic compound transport system substrate-binding protein